MKWFYNMKISFKLLLGFTLVVLIAAAIGVVGVLNLNTAAKNDADLYAKATVPIGQMADISNMFQELRVDTYKLIMSQTPEEINAAVGDIDKCKKDIAAITEEFKKTLITAEAGEAYKEFTDALNVFYQELDRAISAAKMNFDNAASSVLSEGSEMSKAIDNVRSAVAKLNTIKDATAKQKADENDAMAKSASSMMTLILVVAVVVALVLGIYISTSVSRPVNKLVKAADKIAQGDLDVNIDINTKDEIGKLAASFRNMADNINEVMSNINASAQQVASGARQIADSAQALSQGATEQASSIEQLTASLEEISAQTNQNATKANQANKLALLAKDSAANGNEQMAEMLKAMDEINQASSNISKIIKVIEEIAFQTNILALNAAVEAARAGQHGRGFAVVAEEVRNLAVRSANAAKETTDMIEGSIKKVEVGTKISNSTAQALGKIVEVTEKVAGIVSDIAIASNEQATGIAQINQGVMQISQVVQSNSATSEESASASEELSSQAEMLKELAGRFKLKTKKKEKTPLKLEDLSPEVLKKIEEMLENNNLSIDAEQPEPKEAEGEKEEPSDGGAEGAEANAKVAVSDNEFGKY